MKTPPSLAGLNQELQSRAVRPGFCRTLFAPALFAVLQRRNK
jgi:hypothetical protein